MPPTAICDEGCWNESVSPVEKLRLPSSVNVWCRRSGRWRQSPRSSTPRARQSANRRSWSTADAERERARNHFEVRRGIGGQAVDRDRSTGIQRDESGAGQSLDHGRVGWAGDISPDPVRADVPVTAGRGRGRAPRDCGKYEAGLEHLECEATTPLVATWLVATRLRGRNGRFRCR